MKIRRIQVLVLAGLASAVVTAPAADAAVGDKVTGGGQVFFSADQNGTKPTGALNTIGFNAQQTATDVKGQVQFIDRSAGKGRSQVRYHGIVDCINVMGNQALIGGVKRGGGPRFQMYVEDNGEGANAAGADVITFNNKSADPNCEFDDNDNDVQIELARGNVQVHGSTPTDPGFPENAQSSTTALRTLFGL